MGAQGTLIPVFSPRRVLGGLCFPPHFGGEKGGGRRPLAGPAAAARQTRGLNLRGAAPESGPLPAAPSCLLLGGSGAGAKDAKAL